MKGILIMDYIEKNALFTKDEQGVIIITDINDSAVVVRGEAVYDGKNAVVLNRNNKEYYALKNIPPFIRDVLSKSETVTIVESKAGKDIYSYSVKVRIVDDLGLDDDWEEYSGKIMTEMEKHLTPQQLSDFMNEAEKIYKKMTK